MGVVQGPGLAIGALQNEPQALFPGAGQFAFVAPESGNTTGGGRYLGPCTLHVGVLASAGKILVDGLFETVTKSPHGHVLVTVVVRSDAAT